MIEQCTEPYWRQLLSYPGYYFGLGSWDSQERRREYIATLDSHEGFRECEFAIEGVVGVAEDLKAISIPLGSSVGASHGGSGLPQYRAAAMAHWPPQTSATEIQTKYASICSGKL
ncbi:MAG: hypothetical protein WCC08_03715 [Terrimicrobiaceae bacterium]